MKRRSNFTLVELMVAMGVFVILLMVSMQIFSGARKLWVSSEQKNSAFAAARTAMEFVAARIQTAIYTENMPFEISNRQGSGAQQHYEEIFFATSIPMNRRVQNASGVWVNLDVYDVRFIGFRRNTSGVLEMRIFSDRINGSSPYSNFARLLPPYRRRRGSSGGMTYTNACGVIASHLNNASGNDLVEIIENVTSFKLIPFNMAGRAANARVQMDTADTIQRTLPYLLEIEISIIDSKDNFRRWLNAANAAEREEIETESGYTFRRAVLLGDRRNER